VLDRFSMVKQRRVRNALFFAMSESNESDVTTAAVFVVAILCALVLTTYVVVRRRRSRMRSMHRLPISLSHKSAAYAV
jgi:uncharacterized membrane protein YhaH (DUF805 family)